MKDPSSEIHNHIPKPILLKLSHLIFRYLKTWGTWHAWTMRKNKMTKKKIELQNDSYQNTNRNNNLPVPSFSIFSFLQIPLDKTC